MIDTILSHEGVIMTTNEKIQELMIANGFSSVASLAREISKETELTHKTRTNYTRYMSGAVAFPIDTLKLISRKLRVTLDYLIDDNKNVPEFLVPLCSMASCGKGNMYYSDDQEFVVTSTFGNKGVYAVRADGDSMSYQGETNINNGDILFCDPSVAFGNGDIVHYHYNGESGIKKYYEDIVNETVTLVANNQKYAPITINPSEYDNIYFVKVVGKEQRF